MGAEVDIKNITEEYGVLSIAGPRAEQLLSRVTDSQVHIAGGVRGPKYCGAQGRSAPLQGHRQPGTYSRRTGIYNDTVVN